MLSRNQMTADEHHEFENELMKLLSRSRKLRRYSQEVAREVADLSAQTRSASVQRVTGESLDLTREPASGNLRR